VFDLNSRDPRDQRAFLDAIAARRHARDPRSPTVPSAPAGRVGGPNEFFSEAGRVAFAAAVARGQVRIWGVDLQGAR
jgi:hypothetical protein